MNFNEHREVISVEEAVQLGAADSLFYTHYFFPKTVRQGTPEFHGRLWNLFETNRQVAVKIFRGGAKTTTARLFGSKRIAYGISKTILFISKSETHAIYSVDWLRHAIEFNALWASTFGLEPGNKWAGDEIEIIHRDLEMAIRVLALGITGSVRGVNIQDYRPDLIIVDDPCDEENTATPEQREKISKYFFGAIKESLAPASEEPTAALILLQTPLDGDDLVAQCFKSEDFAHLSVGILTHEGEEPICESAWPERWTKEEILAEKKAAIQRNQLSIWMREKMCKLIGKETSVFFPNWLQRYEVLPIQARYVMAIDPAPILSDKSRMLGIETDLQAVMVCAYWQGKKFVVEYATARDQDPEKLARELDRLARKYPVLRCGVEGVAYQRNLKWFLEKEMKEGRCKHLRLLELNVGAPGSKYNRIVQAHTGRGSSGCLFCKAEHFEFIEQFESFPNIKFKDLLDVSAMCDAAIMSERNYMFDEAGNIVDESHIPDQLQPAGCP